MSENNTKNLYMGRKKRKDHHIWWSCGALARIRTGGVPLRRRTLYPAEVQTHMKFIERYKFYKNNTKNYTNFDFKALATQDVSKPRSAEHNILCFLTDISIP